MRSGAVIAVGIGSLAILAWVGCVGDDPSGSDPPPATDPDARAPADAGGDAALPADAAEPADASARCDPAKDFGSPEVVPELSAGAQDIAARLTPNELTVFWGRSIGAPDRDLYTATRTSVAEPFPLPTLLTALSTGQEEGKPTLTADNKRLYFHRNRDPVTDYDIWLAQQDFSGGFTTPVKLDAIVNEVGGSNNDPYVSPGGEELFFARRVSGAARLFVASDPKPDGQFGAVTELTTVTTAQHRASPVVSHDRLSIYFAAGATPDATTVHIATRATPDDTFDPGVEVPGIGSIGRTEPSWVSPDGCVLYVFSNRSSKFQIFRALRPR